MANNIDKFPKLEPYNGRASRHRCPSCGKKDQFTRYVDSEGKHIADHVGKCNRVDKCGYHYPPRDYFADNPDQKTKPAKKRRRTKPKPPPPVDYIPERHQLATLPPRRAYADNQFITWLASLIGEEQAHAAAGRYQLGTEKNGGCIFWQIDRQGRIRTGKIRNYDTAKGKGLNVDWIHSRLAKKTGEAFNMQQVYFGSHLLGLEANKGKTVAIVEGEKTAVLMSAIWPDYVWVSTGSCANFGIDCKVNFSHLKGFNAIVFPDTGKYKQWQEKADRARYLGFNISVDDFIERQASTLGKNADLVDLYLHEKANPTAKPLPAEAKPETRPIRPPAPATQPNTPPTRENLAKPPENATHGQSRTPLDKLIECFDLIDPATGEPPTVKDIHAPNIDHPRTDKAEEVRAMLFGTAKATSGAPPTACPF